MIHKYRFSGISTLEKILLLFKKSHYTVDFGYSDKTAVLKYKNLWNKMYVIEVYYI